MADLDVKRIEEAAFAAIDEIFSDGAGKEGDELIVELQSKILALDWEYSDKDIKDLLSILTKLKVKYSDKINSVLILMMSNIAKFLIAAKEKSPSDTLSILAYIVDFFVKYNSSQISEQDKKEHIKEIKAKYAKLKEAIAKLAESKKETELEQTEHKQKDSVKKEPLLSFSEEDKKVEKQEDKINAFVVEIVKKSLSKVEYNLSTIIEENFKYITEKLRKFEENIDSLNKKISSLEDKISTGIKGEQLLSQDKEEVFAEAIQDVGKVQEEKKGEIDFLKDEEIIFSSEIEEEMGVKNEQPEKEEKISLEKVEAKNIDLEEEGELETFDIEEKVLEAPKDIYPYVRLFKVKDRLIAVDDELILNTYKLPYSKIKKLYAKDFFTLKELKAGLFSKISKNMKGSLAGKKDKELKDIEVEVYKYPDELMDKFKYVILIEGDTYKALFVKEPFKDKLFLPEDRQENKDDNVFDFKYKISNVGEAYSFSF